MSGAKRPGSRLAKGLPHSQARNDGVPQVERMIGERNRVRNSKWFSFKVFLNLREVEAELLSKYRRGSRLMFTTSIIGRPTAVELRHASVGWLRTSSSVFAEAERSKASKRLVVGGPGGSLPSAGVSLQLPSRRK